MIEKVYINNYKRFRNCTVNFDRFITLIVGKNGAGKTAFAELVYKLTEFIAGGQSVDHVACIHDIPRWELKDFGKYYTDLEFVYRVQDGLFTYSLQIEHDMKLRDCRIAKESLLLDGSLLYVYDLQKEEQVWLVTDDKREFTYPSDWHYSGLPLASRRSSKIRKFYTNISLCTDTYERFEGEYVKALPKYINQIASANDEYKYFITDLAHVSVDEHDRLIFTEKSDNSTYKILFSELSLGQKKLCMYYFLLNIAEAGSTIMMDEFESHLSPAEIEPLYHKLQTVSDELDVQFIIISHNPKTLNWYHKDAIVFDNSGCPAINKVEPYDYENANGTLFQHIQDLGNEL